MVETSQIDLKDNESVREIMYLDIYEKEDEELLKKISSEMPFSLYFSYSVKG